VRNILRVSIEAPTGGPQVQPEAPAVRHLQLQSERRRGDECSESRSDKPKPLRPAQTSPRLPSATEEVHDSDGLRSGDAVPRTAESATHTWRSSSERTGQPSSLTPASGEASSEPGASTASSASATGLVRYRAVTLLKRDADVGGQLPRRPSGHVDRASPTRTASGVVWWIGIPDCLSPATERPGKRMGVPRTIPPCSVFLFGLAGTSLSDGTLPGSRREPTNGDAVRPPRTSRPTHRGATQPPARMERQSSR
jgi:hypothetical protein